MSVSKSKAKIWLPLDRRLLGEDDNDMPFVVMAEKYAVAVRDGMHAQAVTYPLASADDIAGLLHEVDGVLLTGSPANIHPSHFNETVENPSLPLDQDRDSLTLPLVQQCLAHGVPLLGICRGFQEINVALGGSLHQQVQNIPGMLDHRERPGNLEHQYQTVHMVHLVKNSPLLQWAGGKEQIHVNSLHGQGINRLAKGLKVHAHAPDGLIEAIEVANAKTFAYAVQWHPEWNFGAYPFYAALFHAFAQACTTRHNQRCA